MRKFGILLFVVLLVASCGQEETPMVEFRIGLEGFHLKMPSDVESIDSLTITHRLAGGMVIFSNSARTIKFDTKHLSEEGHYFELPEGEYLMEFEVPQASLYGQEGGSYKVIPQSVQIAQDTELLTVQVEATCSLFLVYDASDQLDKGAYMIERHSYSYGFFTSYPLYSGSVAGLYYTYFTPDPNEEDPSAFLWFYGEGDPGEEQGGISTANLQVGYQYNIQIIE